MPLFSLLKNLVQVVGVIDFIKDLLQPEPQDLREKLKINKKVKINGVIFNIRKINVLDYLEGAKVLHEAFSVYKTKSEKEIDQKLVNNIKKAKDYMRDVIMAGVVSPKLVRKQEEDPNAVVVDEILNDWMFAQELCAEILQFTYGKKK